MFYVRIVCIQTSGCSSRGTLLHVLFYFLFPFKKKKLLILFAPPGQINPSFNLGSRFSIFELRGVYVRKENAPCIPKLEPAICVVSSL